MCYLSFKKKCRTNNYLLMSSHSNGCGLSLLWSLKVKCVKCYLSIIFFPNINVKLKKTVRLQLITTYKLLCAVWFIWLCVGQHIITHTWAGGHLSRWISCWHRAGFESLSPGSTSLGCFYPPFQVIHSCLAINYRGWCTVSNNEWISVILHFGGIYGLVFFGLIFVSLEDAQ